MFSSITKIAVELVINMQVTVVRHTVRTVALSAQAVRLFLLTIFLAAGSATRSVAAAVWLKVRAMFLQISQRLTKSEVFFMQVGSLGEFVFEVSDEFWNFWAGNLNQSNLQ